MLEVGGGERSTAVAGHRTLHMIAPASDRRSGFAAPLSAQENRVRTADRHCLTAPPKLPVMIESFNQPLRDNEAGYVVLR